MTRHVEVFIQKIVVFCAQKTRAVQHRGIQRWIVDTGRGIHAVDSIHPLRETALAHEKVETKTKLGTVIVDCADTS